MSLNIVLSAVFAGSAAVLATEQVTQATKPTHGTEQQILAVVDQLTNAGLKRDVATLDRLYAEDYFHTNADGSVMNKAEVLRSYRETPKVVIDSSKHEDDRVQVHANLGVVSCKVTITGRSGDQPFTRQFRVTYVLRKDAGRWVVANSHASVLAQ